MSISFELSRMQTSRNAIRAKLVELGIATGTDKLDVLAAAIDNIVNRGAVSATVQEGDTYTIPAGYHNGSGTVSGVSGGGNYSLQSKIVTPTKKQQAITPDSGYYGMSDVTVAAIPDSYQDVSSVTAEASDVLSGIVFVAEDGTVTTGTMANNGSVSKTLDDTVISYTIPKGFHNGNGTVTIVLEEKSVTPSKSTQTIVPTTGKVMSKVTVAPIPDKYQDVSDVTATAPHVLYGDIFVDSDGTPVEGSMPNRGEVSQSLTPAAKEFTIPEGYHNGSGKVSIITEEKNITPTKSIQTITPANGKVMSKVTVAPIPVDYQDVTGVTATAATVLDGSIIVTSEGAQVEGTMPNNGTMNRTIDGLTATSVSIPAGFTSGGMVSLTDDIEEALSAI